MDIPATSDAIPGTLVLRHPAGGGATTSLGASIDVTQNSETAAVAVRLQRARGTFTSPTPLVNGDVVSNLANHIYDGSTYLISTRIRTFVDGAVSIGSTQARIAFDTRDGTTLAERMCIKASGNIGVGTTSPDADAILDLTSTSQGFLPPRMTTTQRDAIAAPVPAGLMIYNTTTNKINFYNGTAWEAVTSS